MSTVAPAPSTAATEEVGPEVAILFVGVALFLGMVSRHLFKGSRIPYTVVLLLLGIGIGGLGDSFIYLSNSSSSVFLHEGLLGDGVLPYVNLKAARFLLWDSPLDVGLEYGIFPG